MRIEEINDATTREGLLTAMQMKAKALRLEKEADLLKQDAKTLIEAFMDDIDDGVVDAGDEGRLTRVVTNRKTFSADTWKTDLLSRGLNADAVRAIEDNATTYKESTSYRYTPAKEGS